MVKVPGFFASKKSDMATGKPRTVKKTPMVVVHIAKPAPKVINLEKESDHVVLFSFDDKK